MTDLVPPIVIAEDLRGKFWLSVYGSPEAVTRQLEPWFATDEDYRAFDSTGQVIDLIVQHGAAERKFLFFKLSPGDDVLVRPRAGTSRPDELRELLVRFLEQEGRTEGIDQQTPTAELTERCAADHNFYGP